MDKIKSIPIFHAIRPGKLDLENTKIEKKRKIDLNTLIKSYLCCAGKSACVVERACECLDACVYGQQYIEQTSDKNHE